jgi:hypothetical protein
MISPFVERRVVVVVDGLAEMNANRFELLIEFFSCRPGCKDARPVRSPCDVLPRKRKELLQRKFAAILVKAAQVRWVQRYAVSLHDLVPFCNLGGPIFVNLSAYGCCSKCVLSLFDHDCSSCGCIGPLAFYRDRRVCAQAKGAKKGGRETGERCEKGGGKKLK